MIRNQLSLVRVLSFCLRFAILGYLAFALVPPHHVRVVTAAPLLAPGPVNADVSNGSGSQPELNAAGTDWEPFDTNQGVPAKGGIIVLYTPQDLADLNSFPIQTGSATVTLRPSTAGPTLNCTFNAAEPVFSASTADLCFFRVTGGGDGIQIFYMGQFADGEDIRYTISGLTPAAGGTGTFTNFDSDAVVAGTSPSPTGGRAPARLVLVLDKSGSMAWSSHPLDPGCNVFTTPPAGCEPARWEILNDAVNQTLVVAKAYSLPGDRFGAALFDSTVAAANQFAFTTIDPVSVSAFQSDLADPSRGPGGATSIGAGVTAFETDLSSPGAFTQTILLFTDGDQNTAPFLVSNATQVLINETTNSPVGNVAEFLPGVVRLCPFALRADNVNGTLGTSYLQGLADKRCDGLMNSAVSVNPTDPELIQFFLQVLNGALLGDKLEIASVQNGQITPSSVITPSTAPTATVTFTTSVDDISFTMLLNWAERFNGLSDIEMVKDGVVFTLTSDIVVESTSTSPRFALIDQGDNYFAVTMRQPFCNEDGECVDPEGEWAVNFEPFFEVEDTFTYNVFAIVDNASLASEFSVTQSSPGVGQPLLLEAVLTEGGTPLSGLPQGSVVAIVSRPEAGLGNVLSQAEVNPVDNSQDDSINAAGRKASAMLSDGALRDELLAAIEAGLADEVLLTESTPGLYTATYTDTVVEGIYVINFFVDGETPNNSRFARTFETDYYVEVVPDPTAIQESAVISQVATCAFVGGCFSILVTPVDSAGNLLGPGKDPLIFLPLGSAAVLLEPVIDNLDGSYQILVGFPQPIEENPVISIGDVPIRPQIIEEPEPPVDTPKRSQTHDKPRRHSYYDPPEFRHDDRDHPEHHGGSHRHGSRSGKHHRHHR